MFNYYIVVEPTDEEEFNLYLLYKLSFFKHRLLGVYYIPELHYYGPVLQLTTHEYESIKDIVIKIPDKYLKNAFRMVCIRDCGWECKEDSSAFMFEHELKSLEIPIALPFRIVKYRNLTFKVYRLDLGPRRACIFYDSNTKLCRIHSKKPIICLVTYCARYAIKDNEVYIRTKSIKVKVGDQVKYVPIFKKLNPENQVKIKELIIS